MVYNSDEYSFTWKLITASADTELFIASVQSIKMIKWCYLEAIMPSLMENKREMTARATYSMPSDDGTCLFNSYIK